MLLPSLENHQPQRC